MLEDYRPERSESRCLHVLSLSKNETATIGRGNDCDVKISDVSVSRKHSKLKFLDNSFILEDLNSKFGTLVLMKKSFFLQPHTEVTIQIGRTIVHLESKEPFSCKSCLWAFRIKRVVPITHCSYLTQADIIEDSPSAFGNASPRDLNRVYHDIESDITVTQQEISVIRDASKEEEKFDKILSEN